MGIVASLDDRTWNDLDLDAVFVALDRTNSTLGQHALYHRLRTPIGEQLRPFEAIVSRMSRDVASRERAQASLARLQDPHGYDLWWLAPRDAVETPGWYIVFPMLSATALSLLLLTPFWPSL